MRIAQPGPIAALLLVLTAGCTNIGPGTVTRDRFDYNSAIADSWKEQTLLNVVKLRYADTPMFVEVASVVSGYSLESAVSVGGTSASGSAVATDLFNIGTTGKYTDRPTITYAPVTGAHFARSFMTPIPPRAILFLIQSGWTADTILGLTVDSINGLRSRVPAGSRQREGSADYYRVLSLLNQIQRSGTVEMHLKREGEESEATVMFFARDDAPPEVTAAMDELMKLLGVRPGARELTVSYGLLSDNDSEIRMLTRSVLQIMVAFAASVSVPEQDVLEGRALPSLPRRNEAPDGDSGELIRIPNSAERPQDAFVAVRYRDRWFYIDDRDFGSKRTFAFLMLLISLTETGDTEKLPLVTIPAG